MDPIPASLATAAAQTPLWRDFLLSPGFGGLMALLAATIAATAALVAARRATTSQNLDRRQRDQHHYQLLSDGIQSRTEEFRGAAIGRCWDRLVWLIEHAAAAATPPQASTGPLRLGPELMEEMLHLLEQDALRLGDVILARAVNSYLMQFALALAAQTHPPVPGGSPSGGA